MTLLPQLHQFVKHKQQFAKLRSLFQEVQWKVS